MLTRTGRTTSIRYETPFFLLNNQWSVYLKYSTRGRSPWGFTFMPHEQSLLQKRMSELEIVIGLICGADGVAALTYEDYLSVATPRTSALHIACFRQHGERYEVKGPDGRLEKKVAPSNWQRILEN